MPPSLNLSRIPKFTIHTGNVIITIKLDGELAVSRAGNPSRLKVSDKGPSVGLATDGAKATLSKDGLEVSREQDLARGFVNLLATVKPAFNPITRDLSVSWGISTVVKKGGQVMHAESFELTSDGAAKFSHKAGPICVEHAGYKFEGTFGFTVEARLEPHIPAPRGGPVWVPDLRWLLLPLGTFIIKHPRLLAFTIEALEITEEVAPLLLRALPALL